MSNVLYRANLRADTFYCFCDEGGYAYSPDGVGLFWYDSLDELIDQHGDDYTLYHYEGFKEF